MMYSKAMLLYIMTNTKLIQYSSNVMDYSYNQ